MIDRTPLTRADVMLGAWCPNLPPIDADVPSCDDEASICSICQRSQALLARVRRPWTVPAR
jgi:hypothetical protein